MFYRTERADNSQSTSYETKLLLLILAIVFFFNTPKSYLEKILYPYIFAKMDVWTSVYDRQVSAFANYSELAYAQVLIDQIQKPSGTVLVNQLLKSAVNINSTADAYQIRLVRQSELNRTNQSVSKKLAMFYYSGHELATPYLDQSRQTVVTLYYPVSTDDKVTGIIGYIQVTINKSNFEFTRFNRLYLVYQGGHILNGKTPYPYADNILNHNDQDLWLAIEKAQHDSPSGFFKYNDGIFSYSLVDTIQRENSAFLIYQLSSVEHFFYYLPQLIMICLCVMVVVGYIYVVFYKRARRLENQINTDELSRLYNRTYYNRIKHQYVKGNYYTGIIDIDLFKKINDSYGHDVGDAVITRVAGIIKASIREQDLAFRVGGEEFVVIIYAESFEHAETVFERIRSNIEQSDNAPQVTVSIGFTRIKASAEQAFKVADQQMYCAKQAGRNRVAGQRV